MNPNNFLPFFVSIFYISSQVRQVSPCLWSVVVLAIDCEFMSSYFFFEFYRNFWFAIKTWPLFTRWIIISDSFFFQFFLISVTNGITREKKRCAYYSEGRTEQQPMINLGGVFSLQINNNFRKEKAISFEQRACCAQSSCVKRKWLHCCGVQLIKPRGRITAEIRQNKEKHWKRGN